MIDEDMVEVRLEKVSMSCLDENLSCRITTHYENQPQKEFVGNLTYVMVCVQTFS